ncbi:uncharacterized protein LOC105424322 [Pogonomyrmex barbatus]|uniref:Uncharacterized protein LOC105424322 n=1 Tax=Pogonomyrmex barbatus TaxID=144034 RepID=A0A6I9VUL7_9HYME|nr:uncharacterized protein LOC105424322 [Pogonomyrmex barbatus]
MLQLHYIAIISINIIMLVYADITEGTGQSAIVSTTTDFTIADIETQNEFNMKMYNGCECIKYDCGCCQHLEWDEVSMDGRLCANASYLEKDYGISVTVTYNNFTIINETVSARNPPPICFGEDIVDALDVEICLHIYDIDVKVDMFHACFEIFGRIMKLRIAKIQLGCIQTKLHEKTEYIESNLLPIFFKRKEKDMLPNVVMV